jgi:hypothetical protein
MTVDWVIQTISAELDMSAFDSGEPSLNDFLKKYALANDSAGLGRT